nr:MAG TPA: hypothetical protein [Caudoviricetes sp.]
MIGSVRGGNEPSLAYRKKELRPLFYKVLALFLFFSTFLKMETAVVKPSL